jgi:hypothetical protein
VSPARGTERSWLVAVAIRHPQTYLDGRSQDWLRLAKDEWQKTLGPWLYPHAYQAHDVPLAVHTVVSLSKGLLAASGRKVSHLVGKQRRFQGYGATSVAH